MKVVEKVTLICTAMAECAFVGEISSGASSNACLRKWLFKKRNQGKFSKTSESLAPKIVCIRESICYGVKDGNFETNGGPTEGR